MLAYLSGDIICSEKPNSELRGTDNVQGQISEHTFAAKLTLLWLVSIVFKNWGISIVKQIPACRNGKRKADETENEKLMKGHSKNILNRPSEMFSKRRHAI